MCVMFISVFSCPSYSIANVGARPRGFLSGVRKIPLRTYLIADAVVCVPLFPIVRTYCGYPPHGIEVKSVRPGDVILHAHQVAVGAVSV